MGDKMLASLLITTAIVSSVNIGLSSLSAATGTGIFKHRTGDVSKRHPSLITPIGWTFAIWSLIYLWLIAAIVYLLINLFRPNRNGFGKMYCNPQIFSKSVSLAMIVNQIFSITWLFVWNHEQMTGSAIILILIAISNWITLVWFSQNLYRATEYLSTNAKCDLWIYRLLVQNGLALHTAWTTLACLLNTTLAAIYDVGLSDRLSSLTCLSVLTCLIIAWTSFSLFLWDDYFRFMFTPLFTFGWGLSGIHARVNSLTQTNDVILISHFITGLLFLTIVCNFFKISLSIYRQFRKPLTPYYPSSPLSI